MYWDNLSILFFSIFYFFHTLLLQKQVLFCPKRGSSTYHDELDAMSSTYAYYLPPYTIKFISFAECHLTVLNEILRQTATHFGDGPFPVLLDHTQVLKFDWKRGYIRTGLERTDAST